MAGHHAAPRRIGVVLAALALSIACSQPNPTTKVTSSGPARGGDLVMSVRAEPRSWTLFTSRDATTYVLTLLTSARLVRINAATQDLEPWLAESWQASDDGKEYVLKLRPHVTFADGTPFTAADVVFSLAAAYAKDSTLNGVLRIGDAPLSATARDALTVVFTYPSRFGAGVRLLDSLPILPKHKLEAALREGTFGGAWNAATPPSEMTGLGPFVPSEYRPGERIVLTRNPHYFRKDAAGVQLPYLDRVVIEVVPDQNAQLLRLQSGQDDGSAFEVRAEDYAPLKKAAAQGTVQLLDAGPSIDLDAFWINLTPGAFDRDPRRAWIQRDELREAISLAVDRQRFVDAVFLGAGVPAFGPVSPSNKRWYSDEVPRPSHDPARARTVLASLGLTDRDADGVLEDGHGAKARFTLLTQKGQTPLERGASVIAEELKKIGIVVDVVALEGNALIAKFLSGKDYDAVYFHLASTDTDPAMNPDLWLSSGGAHVWNLGQKAPSTDWERTIDRLMQQQMGSRDDAERRRLFVEVQKLFAAHQPIVYFGAPRVFVAASSRVTNTSLAVSRPQLLWAADQLAVKH